MNQTLQGLPTGLSRTGCDSVSGLRSGYVAVFTPLLCIACVANLALGAEPSALGKAVVAISTSWSATGVKAGGLINLAVILDIQERYHINASTAQDPFIPTSIQLESGPSFVLSSTAVFPDALEIDFGIDGAKERIKVFSGRTVAYLPMVVDGSAVPGKHEIKIRMRYQACNDTICLPPVDVIQSVELNLVPVNAEVQSIQPELFQALDALRDRLNVPFFGLDFQIAPSKLWLLLMIAAVGGFLLNLTPCVLPLIPIKILSLAKTSGDRRRCFLLGLTLSFGVVAFWIGLAIAISTISGFNATNKLFQYPIFTVTVGIVICIMAVGMSGLFSIRLPSWAYAANPSQGSAVGSFLFGIMTAVLSTPCTAPFMGAAAAWSATQPPAITIATFAAIGIGMALPYLLLSAFPSLVSRVPRAGPASELVKQVMGLLVLAAGAYFLGTGLAGTLAEPPDPPTQAYWWVVAGFIGAAGVWLFWRTFQIAARMGSRIVFGSLALAILFSALVIGVRFTRTSPIHWVYFNPDRFTTAEHQAKVVVLEFTAAWCLNCHALEQAVLHDPRVTALLNSTNVISIKVDLTGNNPAGNRKLIEAGRRTIPYLVIYSPEGNEIFASDAYTVDQIIGAISKANSTVLAR